MHLLAHKMVYKNKILEGDICTYAEAQQTFHYCTSLVRRLLFTKNILFLRTKVRVNQN
jgi:hypothetical protein